MTSVEDNNKFNMTDTSTQFSSTWTSGLKKRAEGVRGFLTRAIRDTSLFSSSNHHHHHHHHHHSNDHSNMISSVPSNHDLRLESILHSNHHHSTTATTQPGNNKDKIFRFTLNNENYVRSSISISNKESTSEKEIRDQLQVISLSNTLSDKQPLEHHTTTYSSHRTSYKESTTTNGITSLNRSTSSHSKVSNKCSTSSSSSSRLCERRSVNSDFGLNLSPNVSKSNFNCTISPSNSNNSPIGGMIGSSPSPSSSSPLPSPGLYSTRPPLVHAPSYTSTSSSSSSLCKNKIKDMTIAPPLPSPTEPNLRKPLPSSPSLPPPAPSHHQVNSQHIHGFTQHQFDPEFLEAYTLREQLGSGGFGFVLSAIRHSDQREVAVKFIYKNKISSNGWNRDPILGLVPMEIFLLKNIHHENIILFLDFYEDNSFFYLITELHGSEWVGKKCTDQSSNHQNHMNNSHPSNNDSSIHNNSHCSSSMSTVSTTPTITPTTTISSTTSITTTSTSTSASSTSSITSHSNNCIRPNSFYKNNNIEPLLTPPLTLPPTPLSTCMEDSMDYTTCSASCPPQSLPPPHSLSFPPPPPPISMKRRNSMDLFECIEQHSKFTERQARHIFKQIVSALSYLDSYGIVHR